MKAHIICAVTCALALAVPAQAAELDEYAAVDQPVHVTSPPDDSSRTFIVEIGGRIRVVDHERLVEEPFLDISADVHADGLYGLLSMAFAPDYAKSGRFYVFYTNRQNETEIEEFRRSADPNRARLSSRRTVLALELPTPYESGEPHLGGQLAFGPDGFLYISTGDGSRGYVDEEVVKNAQRLRSPFGKLLRIDPTAKGRAYRVPPSNPFVGRRGRDEIYAYGLRNPWRFSFDGRRLVVADPGEEDIEEIDMVPLALARGANFGWPMFEGTLRHRRSASRRGVTFPVFEYEHRSDAPVASLYENGCSGAVVGGFVARDASVPSLMGRYVYGDYCFAQVRSFRPRDPYGTDRLEFDGWPLGLLPNSFGMDSTGRLFAAFQQLGEGSSVFQVTGP
jgi:glucose/arabinose dehydrogenase